MPSAISQSLPATLVAIASLVSLPGCEAELPPDLDVEQATEVVTALSAVGIAAKRQTGSRPESYRVVVAGSARDDANAVLAERGLPRAPRIGSATLPSGALLPSPSMDRARIAAAKSVDIERLLAALPGVIAARVAIEVPVAEPLRVDGARPRPTASVLLRTSGAFAMDEQSIRGLVSGAVEALHPADIALSIAAEPSVAAASSRLVPFGPIEVSVRTQRVAIVVVSVAVATMAALATALIFSTRGWRRQRSSIAKRAGDRD